jgi:hypothetical protein
MTLLRRSAAHLALPLTAAFPTLVIALHFLKPGLDPSWRLISEYELPPAGWIMALAFLCLAGGCLTLVIATRPSTPTIAGHVGQTLLVIVSLGLAVAAIFTTDPITTPTATLSGNVHNAAAYLVILGFPIAAYLISRALKRQPAWASARRRLTWLTLLTWGGLIAFVGSALIMADDGMLGPNVLVGWPNRVMMITYTLWVLAVARHAQRLNPASDR